MCQCLRKHRPLTCLVITQGTGMKLIFSGGHISLAVAFEGPNVILGLYKCNYSLMRGKELSAAARQKQGAGPDKTRWRAGFGLQALCLPPVTQGNCLKYRKFLLSTLNLLSPLNHLMRNYCFDISSGDSDASEF